MRGFDVLTPLVLLGAALGSLACGGRETENDGGTGGTSAIGGMTSGSGSAGGLPGSGGVSSGGSAAPGTGGLDGGCPPPGPLWPIIGPWMTGPHPGPCSMNDGQSLTTYVYDAAGTLLRGDIDDGGTETYTRDLEGRITRFEGGFIEMEADYSTPGTMILHWRVDGDWEGISTYTLDATGRPTVWQDEGGTSGEYIYEDCRVVRAELADSNTEVLYTYDAAGNLIQRDVGTDQHYLFDYSCW